MKKLLILLLGITVSFTGLSQDLPQNLYLLFEFMNVPDDQGTAYLEVEEYWSGIHQERVADGSILGWSLWALSPSGTEQGAQYLTVTLFSSMEAMMTSASYDQIVAYAKKAHSHSDKEVEAMMTKTLASRNIMYQAFSRRIGYTQNEPPRKEGMLVLIGFMKQISTDYVEVEKAIFLPMHQQAVNNGEMMGWGLCEILLPIGTENYATHMTFNFYENEAKMARWFQVPTDENLAENMAANQGLATREMKHVKFGRLIRMVR